MESTGVMSENPVYACRMGHYEPMFFLIVAAFLLFVALPILIVKIVAWWKICTKAGLSGWLSLVMLIPGANLFLPLIVAFIDWPALRDLKAVQQAPAGPPHA